MKFSIGGKLLGNYDMFSVGGKYVLDFFIGSFGKEKYIGSI